MLILPALLLLVLLVTVVAGLAFGAGPMAGGGRHRAVPLAGGAVVGLGAVGVLVVAVLAFGVLGRSPSDDEDPAPERVAPTTSTTAASEPAPSPSAPVALPIRGLGPTVRIERSDESAAVGRLEPATVLQVEARGFDPFTAARAQQCVDEGERRCGNPLPVQFGEDGRASFQYFVSDEFVVGQAPGRCRADDPPCSIVISAADGEGDVRLWTVFRDPVPPRGRIEVTPSSGIVEGQAVTVELEGFQPGAQLQARLCALAGQDGPQRCRPEQAASVETNSRGRGRVTVGVDAGATGSDDVRCDRSNRCGIAVASTSGIVRSNTVPLVFTKPPGAEYDTIRLAAGLAVAALLVLVIVWLIRSTDWSPVGEAAAPEIDEAEYADLDALVAMLPPEEEDVPV